MGCRSSEIRALRSERKLFGVIVGVFVVALTSVAHSDASVSQYSGRETQFV